MQLASRYSQRFSFQKFEPTGANFARRCFIFPGQGAARAGMYKTEIKTRNVFKRWFERTDIFAKSKDLEPPSFFLSNPEALKNPESVRNLALFTASLACHEDLDKKLRAEILTGHSFGEYAVWVAAGVVNFNDMLEIVQKRDEFSPALNETGTMIAVSLSEADFKKLELVTPVTLANINSPSQIVLSSAKADVASLIKELKQRKIAARKLDSVARPYHSPLMSEAREAFLQFLNNFSIKLGTSTKSVMSSVSGKFYPQGYQFSLAEFNTLLADQLIKPVNFLDQILKIRERGVASFLDFSSDKTYAGFVGDILVGADFVALGAGDIGRFNQRSGPIQNYQIDRDANPFFKLLTKFIGDVTGYDLAEIQVEDNFQEDLRIDSIKKAEIIFRALEASNVAIGEEVILAQMEHVGDVVLYLEGLQKQSRSKIATRKRQAQFATLTPVWSPISTAASVENPQFQFWELSANKCSMTNKESTSNLDVFVYTPQPELNLKDWVERLKQLGEIQEGRWLSRNQNRVVLVGKQSDGGFCGLRAFFKSLAKETGGFVFQSLLTDGSESLESSLERLASFQLASDFKVEKGKWFVRRFIDWEMTPAPKTRSLNVLAIGGAKGLGRELLRRAPSAKIDQLTVVGRSDKSKVESSKIAKSDARFKYLQLDAIDLTEKNLEGIDQIDLVLHAAGVESSTKLSVKNSNEIYQELATKISVNEQLSHNCALQKTRRLNFSSVAGVFGNEGQTAYAFANGYLHASEDCVTVAWPPLDRVGMTENLGILQKLKSSGVSLLSAKKAAEWFWGLIEHEQLPNELILADRKDVLLSELMGLPLEKLGKSLGFLSSADILQFRKTYSLKEHSYLHDHSIESTIVLPASHALAQICILGECFFKIPPLVRDFAVKNVLVIDREGAQTSELRADIKSSEELAVSLVSRVENFSAQLVARDLNLESQRLEKFIPTKEVVVASVYSEKFIAFGAKFRTMQECFIDDQLQILSLGHDKVPYYTGHDRFDEMAYMFELGFQTLSTQCILKGIGLGLPLSVGTIRFYNRTSGPLKATSHIKSFSDEGFIGAIWIWDHADQLIAHLDDVTMAVIRKYDDKTFDLREIPNREPL